MRLLVRRDVIATDLNGWMSSGDGSALGFCQTLCSLVKCGDRVVLLPFAGNLIINKNKGICWNIHWYLCLHLLQLQEKHLLS